MATDKQILQNLFHQIRDHVEFDVLQPVCMVCERPIVITSFPLCYQCETTMLTETARQMVDPEGLEI